MFNCSWHHWKNLDQLLFCHDIFQLWLIESKKENCVFHAWEWNCGSWEYLCRESAWWHLDKCRLPSRGRLPSPVPGASFCCQSGQDSQQSTDLLSSLLNAKPNGKPETVFSSGVEPFPFPNIPETNGIPWTKLPRVQIARPSIHSPLKHPWILQSLYAPERPASLTLQACNASKLETRGKGEYICFFLFLEERPERILPYTWTV